MGDMAEAADLPQRPSRRALVLRFLVLAATGALVVVFWADVTWSLRAFARWVDGLGPAGPAVFVAGYAVATVALVPGWILGVAAGAIFGLLAGTAYVVLGATLGAMGAFVVARGFARGAVERWLARSARFAAVDRAVAGRGVVMVLLLRLSPVVPYNVLNYALGLTGISWRANLVGCAAMVPGTLLYVASGDVAGRAALAASGADAPVEHGGAYWGLLAAGLAATLVVTVLLARVARRAIREQAAVAGTPKPTGGASPSSPPGSP